MPAVPVSLRPPPITLHTPLLLLVLFPPLLLHLPIECCRAAQPPVLLVLFPPVVQLARTVLAQAQLDKGLLLLACLLVCKVDLICTQAQGAIAALGPTCELAFACNYFSLGTPAHANLGFLVPVGMGWGKVGQKGVWVVF
jgi:hypothetical protein